MSRAYIISIGNELLTGRTVDTNASWLAGRLMEMGIQTAGVSVVADEMDDIVSALTRGADCADMILVTGGLGPTDDDITRQAMGRFLGVELQFQQGLVEQIEAFFKGRDIEMAPINRVQAYLPAGSEPIANSLGTAPGMLAHRQDKIFVCMPGVPSEMKRMFSDYVAGQLERFADGKVDGRADGKIVLVKKIGCFGTGESNIAQMLGDMMRRGRSPLVNCTASVGVVTLHIVARASDRACAEAMICTDADKIRNLLGELVFGQDDQTIAEVVGERLGSAGKTIATAESCTGGLVAKMLTDSPGASGYFTHGWVTYSDRAKIDELGIDEKLLARHGAVSEQVAEAMATCARKRAGADVAIGITGIAGPGGQTEQKPLGLVFISVDIAGKCTTVRKVFSNSTRSHVRLRAGLTALNMVRLELGD